MRRRLELRGLRARVLLHARFRLASQIRNLQRAADLRVFLHNQRPVRVEPVPCRVLLPANRPGSMPSLWLQLWPVHNVPCWHQVVRGLPVLSHKLQAHVVDAVHTLRRRQETAMFAGLLRADRHRGAQCVSGNCRGGNCCIRTDAGYPLQAQCNACYSSGYCQGCSAGWNYSDFQCTKLLKLHPRRAPPKGPLSDPPARKSPPPA